MIVLSPRISTLFPCDVGHFLWARSQNGSRDVHQASSETTGVQGQEGQMSEPGWPRKVIRTIWSSHRCWRRRRPGVWLVPPWANVAHNFAPPALKWFSPSDPPLMLLEAKKCYHCCEKRGISPRTFFGFFPRNQLMFPMMSPRLNSPESVRLFFSPSPAAENKNYLPFYFLNLSLPLWLPPDHSQVFKKISERGWSKIWHFGQWDCSWFVGREFKVFLLKPLQIGSGMFPLP